MSKEVYVKGFRDAVEAFESTIQIEIDSVGEDPSKKTFVKALDSIIATLYLCKLNLDDMTRLERETEELFKQEGDIFGDVFNLEDLLKIFEEEDGIDE